MNSVNQNSVYVQTVLKNAKAASEGTSLGVFFPKL
jgi:hypothetical protein